MPPSPTIPRLDLDAGAPGHTQVESWRTNVAPLWEISVDPEAATRFHGTSKVHHLGRSIMGQVSVSGHQLWRSGALIGRMGVDHMLVQVRSRGAFHAEADGRVLDSVPGDVVLFDMARPLAAWSEDYEGTTLAMSRGLISSYIKDMDALHGTVIPGATPLGALAYQHVHALGSHVGRFSAVEAASAVEGTAALLSACAGQSVVRRDQVGPAASSAVLLAVRRYIEDHLASPGLTTEALALRFGLSRSALYRSFEPVGGVARYIVRCRLAAAYRELATLGSEGLRPVGEIARYWGFARATSFVHAFRREFGLAPRDVRAAALAGHVGPVPLPSGRVWTDLYQWVVNLSA